MIFLYLLLSLVALVLLVALFVKKDYEVAREIVIDRPKDEVFDFIKYLKNQDQYSVWNKMDPQMRKTYSGIDGTVGFVYKWDSDNKKVGSGEQEIKQIREGESVQSQLHFIKPFEGFATATMTTTAVSESRTKVVWDLKSSMKYPMNFMLLFLNMDQMIGKDFQQNLENLKALLENK